MNWNLTFRAEYSIPSIPADALKGHIAVTVLTSRERNALVASITVETHLTSAFPWPFAIP